MGTQNPPGIPVPNAVGVALMVVVVLALAYVVYINTIAPCLGTGPDGGRACKKAIVGIVLAVAFGAAGINAYRNPGNPNKVDAYRPDPTATTFHV